ncbi:MAG: PAS domain S-box protein [Acidobacteriota bacterium]|nr:PAS domain S-box protein [Acidobacteriota bacterium]
MLEPFVASLAEALDSLIDPMVLLRPVVVGARITDFEYVDANLAATAFLGTTRERLIGSRLANRETPVLSGLFAHHERVHATGEPLVLTDYSTTNQVTGLSERYEIRETRVGDVLCLTWRDVTQREELLDHFRLLAENASDVVFRVDVDLSIDWVSPSIAALQGFEPGEVTGRPLSDFCHPKDLASLLQLIEDTPDDEKGEMELRVVKADATYRWCSLIGRRIIQDGVTAGYVGSLRDVDEEHSRRERQRESDRRYRLLAENTSDVVTVSQAGGPIEWVSASVATLLGWRPEDLVGRRFVDFVHAEDRATLDTVRTHLERGEVGRPVLRVRTASGGYHWVSLRVRDVTDPETGERQRVSSWRDAEGQVANQSALNESVARFRLLAENASDVVLQLGDDLVVEWASPSCEQVLGWAPSSLVGRRADEFILPEDHDALVPPVSASADARTHRIRFRMPGGANLWMSARVKRASGALGEPRGLVVAMRDVSGEVEARETLIASEARFRLLAENASDIVISTDAETRMQWVSPAVSRVLGWRPEQWIGRDPIDFIHRDDHEKVATHRAAALRGERGSPLEVRFLDTEGSAHWMSGLDHLVRGRDGEVTARVIGLRDIDAEVAALDSMAHAEAQYQMLAENASDIVMQVNNESVITWVSPSVRQVLGWEPRQVIGTTSWGFLHTEDRDRVLALRERFFSGERVEPFEVRAETKGRDLRWISMRPQPVRDDAGRITATVMGIRDVHAEVLGRHALTTLSEGSRALVRATDESQLLGEMCEIATGAGGYAFAWYGRRVDDEAKSTVCLASSEKNRDYLDGVRLTWADVPHGQGPTGRAIRLDRTIVTPDFERDARFAPWIEAARRHGLRTSVALPVRVDGQVDGAFMVYASETEAFDGFAVSLLEDLAAELGYGIARLREQAKLVAAINEQRLLTSAIEQATESVLILDPSFTILYANPSTLRTSGYELSEVLGRKPLMFGDGRPSPAGPHASTLALSKGEAWTGTFSNRRKNGELYEEDATISPIHDEGGRLIAYVEVKNDRTSERRLQSDLHRTQSDLSSFTELMKSMRSAETLHASAYLFCEAAIQLPGVDVVGVLLRQGARDLLPISVAGSTIFDAGRERLIPVLDPDFYERLGAGPLTATPTSTQWSRNPDIADALAAEGVVALALAPIRWDGQIIAVLALGTRNRNEAELLESRLNFYEEIATYAGGLLGPQAHTFERRSVIRAQVDEVIARGRFASFFQPFVDLRDGSVVGYEALTRFDDGSRPDDRILDAHSVGLGVELEVALAAASLEAARDLDPGAFVSLNFSPDTLTGGYVDAVVAGATRPLVIEITEHHPIEDCAEIIDAMGRLAGCELAVDDGGAGYMSLAKILELNPRYVKLDLSLVRDVDTNEERNSMVAGICHFAVRSGKVIVAEGIETMAEADEIRRLGADLPDGYLLGQGYLFGRPAPVGQLARRAQPAALGLPVPGRGELPTR